MQQSSSCNKWITFIIRSSFSWGEQSNLKFAENRINSGKFKFSMPNKIKCLLESKSHALHHLAKRRHNILKIARAHMVYCLLVAFWNIFKSNNLSFTSPETLHVGLFFILPAKVFNKVVLPAPFI